MQTTDIVFAKCKACNEFLKNNNREHFASCPCGKSFVDQERLDSHWVHLGGDAELISQTENKNEWWYETLIEYIRFDVLMNHPNQEWIDMQGAESAVLKIIAEAERRKEKEVLEEMIDKLVGYCGVADLGASKIIKLINSRLASLETKI